MAVLSDLKRQLKLKTLLSSAADMRRPLLTHLSADNSWLLSIPHLYNNPAAPNQDRNQKNRKVFSHLLLDAWLTPDHVAVPGARWFQVQHHIETPAFPSIAAVVDLIADIETAASAGKDMVGGIDAKIDAVVVGHKVSDHLHYDTLKQVDASVPVFAAAFAIPIVHSWNHFKTVLAIPELETNNEVVDWKIAPETQAPHLPPWLAVWRIPGPQTSLGLHWGVCIVFQVDGTDQEQTECVIQSPHGLYLEDIAVLKRLKPEVKPLALLQTTKESTFYGWGKANLGTEHGIQIAEAVGPRYWISTHDELLATTGINKWFLKDIPHKAAEAIKEEKRNGKLNGLEFVQIDNGDSFLLI